MNWLDVVIIIALLIAVFSGLKNGLVKGVVTLAGLVIGIVLAGRHYQSIGVLLPESWGGAADIVGFVIILALVMLAAAVVAFILRNILKAIMLGWLDRLGGAVFGFLISVFFWGMLLAVLTKYMDSLGAFGDTIANSIMAKLLLDIFPFILGLLPTEFDIVTSYFV